LIVCAAPQHLQACVEKSISGFSHLEELCRLIKEVFSLAKIVFYPKLKIVSLLLPSHNIHHFIFNVQFSRYILLRFTRRMKPLRGLHSQAIEVLIIRLASLAL